MKNILIALVFAIVLAGVSYAQEPTRDRGVKTAVVEFTPTAGAAGMNDQAKRELHTTLSARLNHTRKFHVYDTRHTRNASQANLAAINGTSTAAAVKLGKQLGVTYVLTGTVIEYNTKGSAKVAFRLVETATGKVRYSGQISQQATMRMSDNPGAPEMQAKVLKALIDRMTEELAGEF